MNVSWSERIGVQPLSCVLHISDKLKGLDGETHSQLLSHKYN